MISPMNDGDSEPDRKPDAIEEPSKDAEGRISEERDGDGEARVSGMELGSGGPDSEVGPTVNSDGGDFGEATESKDSEVKVESSSTEEEEEDDDEDEDDDAAAKSTGAPFNSLLSEFDAFVANEKSGQMATSRALRYGFEAGDMVWGKVKSHPWWPGHVYNDALATPQVRRTRREGHVLVAFFGDSSYGWFDPAEFIPFDANFSEKSKQTSSRNFTRALEEAVDETCRRRGLGLVCKCRSPYSFRAAEVQGYFVVDVPDYEPAAIYSAKQIQKSRDSFNPGKALAFVKNMALSPRSGDDKDLEFAKNRATVVAYRKAVFEEFDVTYAQAFGVQPGRPARDRTGSVDHQAKQPPRAPLSGPLVIAETLGGGKSAVKGKKVKDGSKKDKYLLKRRDESGNLKKSQQVSQGKVSSSAVGDGDFQLQKRPPTATLKPEIVSTTGADSSSNGREAVIADQALASSSFASQDLSVDTKPSIDKGTDSVKEVKEESRSVSDSIAVSKATSASDPCQIKPESVKSEGQGSDEFKREEFQQPQSVSSTVGEHGTDRVQDGLSVEGPSPTPTEVKRSSGMSKVSGVKKAKVKRPREEPDSENVVTEGKKKKKKKQLGTEPGFRDPKKPSVSKKVGKTAKSSLTTKEKVKAEQSKRIASSNNNLSDSSETFPLGGELELPRLLNDLQVLALDPSHGIERSSPAIVRKFFLRFRSLVYQKSLVSPPPESESVEARPSKSSATVGASENSSAEPVGDLPSPKPAKPSFRSEDPTISGRKRAPSDRQEEIAAKRSKKVSDIKTTLASEKKANQRTPEPYRSGEGRESAVPLGRKTRPDPSKRSDPPVRAAEPTMLVMKFPPKTSLPSPAELKARFARFGPMDQSGLRVFWRSSTCRVVFLHKFDAQAACKYAAANGSLFGAPGMRCYVKEVGAAGPDGPDPGKPQGQDDPTTTTTTTKDSSILLRPPPPPTPMQPAAASAAAAAAAAQLKSCLKKTPADDPGLLGAGPGGRGTPRVKFMLAGEESSGSGSTSSNRNNNNNASFGGGGGGGALVHSTSTTSVAMDFSVGNTQKVVVVPLPSSSLPILPLPPQFANNSHHNHNHHRHHDHQHPNDAVTMVGPRNTNISNSPIVDISQQMLSLLSRCNDVVTNVTGLLGYVPFHPL